MRRTHWIALIWLLLGLVVVCVVVTTIGKLQDNATRMDCQNRLYQLGIAISNYASAFDGKMPPGAVPYQDWPPEQRLSWHAAMMPQLVGDGAWGPFRVLAPPDSAQNLKDGSIRFRTYLCPTYVRANGLTLETNYIGIAGVGADAATLPLGHPRAGAFGYDRVLRYPEGITDGMSNTLLVIETAHNLGRWMYGGPSTVRGVEPQTVPYIGVGRPFGGLHVSWYNPQRQVCNILLADASVRSITEGIAPEVLEALATVAGGESLPDNW